METATIKYIGKFLIRRSTNVMNIGEVHITAVFTLADTGYDDYSIFQNESYGRLGAETIPARILGLSLHKRTPQLNKFRLRKHRKAIEVICLAFPICTDEIQIDGIAYSHQPSTILQNIHQ